MVYSRAEHVFVPEHYFTLKYFTDVRKTVSNAYHDNKIQNKITIHRLVTTFWDVASVCLWQMLIERKKAEITAVPIWSIASVAGTMNRLRDIGKGIKKHGQRQKKKKRKTKSHWKDNLGTKLSNPWIEGEVWCEVSQISLKWYIVACTVIFGSICVLTFVEFPAADRWQHHAGDKECCFWITWP
jgi:hypothetical protein